MFEQLAKWDQHCLLAINNCHSSWADWVMWWASNQWVWLPLYLCLTGMIFYRFWQSTDKLTNHKWLGFVMVIAGFGFAVGLSDFVSSGLIKHWVERPRPTHDPMLQGLVRTLNDYRGGQYGFVSSHAANTMACATLFSMLWKRRGVTLLLYLWVALNCYSRMYLGVHYPGDILGGLMVGFLLSISTYSILRCVNKRLISLPFF